MTENEVVKCPKCGKTILDKEAKYCPYCAEPLGEELKLRRARGTFWLGVVFALVGAIIVVFVEPRMDYSRIIPESALELWISGVLCLLGGLSFIVYGYYLIRHEAKGKEGLKP